MTSDQIAILAVALIAIVLVFGIAREMLQRFDSAQVDKSLPAVYRTVNERLRRKFPEFSNEFTVVSAKQMVLAREMRGKDFSKWNDELVKRIDAGEELSEEDGDDFRNVPFSTYLRNTMSEDFVKYINSDVAREKLLATIVSDAYYRGMGVKLRVWIDKDGNWERNRNGKAPPDDW